MWKTHLRKNRFAQMWGYWEWKSKLPAWSYSQAGYERERNGDQMEKPVYLLLENGDYFEGKSFGAPLREVTGEVVFTTGMTGYLETITDPSYFGQIVVQTFPLIGNYGVIPQDFENEEVYLSAYIVKEWCQEPSNFRCSGDLDTCLLYTSPSPRD